MKNPALKNSKAFKQSIFIAGLPHKIFVVAFVITLFAALLFFYLAGKLSVIGTAIFAYFVFKPLYKIHEFDDDAWRLYLRALYAPTNFDVRRTTHKSIQIINRDKLISLKQFNQELS